jgi:hypothetical protein
MNPDGAREPGKAMRGAGAYFIKKIRAELPDLPPQFLQGLVHHYRQAAGQRHQLTQIRGNPALPDE